MVAGHEDHGLGLTKVRRPENPMDRLGRRHRNVAGKDANIELDLWHLEGAKLKVQVREDQQFHRSNLHHQTGVELLVLELAVPVQIAARIAHDAAGANFIVEAVVRVSMDPKCRDLEELGQHFVNEAA